MQEVRGIFRACMMSMMTMSVFRTLEAGRRGEEGQGLWVLGCGFSTYSLWSRSAGLCFGAPVLLSRALPRPGGTGAPCPPR